MFCCYIFLGRFFTSYLGFFSFFIICFFTFTKRFFNRKFIFYRFTTYVSLLKLLINSKFEVENRKETKSKEDGLRYKITFRACFCVSVRECRESREWGLLVASVFVCSCVVLSRSLSVCYILTRNEDCCERLALCLPANGTRRQARIVWNRTKQRIAQTKIYQRHCALHVFVSAPNLNYCCCILTMHLAQRCEGVFWLEWACVIVFIFTVCVCFCVLLFFGVLNHRRKLHIIDGFSVTLYFNIFLLFFFLLSSRYT